MTEKTWEQHRAEAAASLAASFERERDFEALLRRHDLMPEASAEDVEKARAMGFDIIKANAAAVGDVG